MLEIDADRHFRAKIGATSIFENALQDEDFYVSERFQHTNVKAVGSWLQIAILHIVTAIFYTQISFKNKNIHLKCIETSRMREIWIINFSRHFNFQELSKSVDDMFFSFVCYSDYDYSNHKFICNYNILYRNFHFGYENIFMKQVQKRKYY